MKVVIEKRKSTTWEVCIYNDKGECIDFVASESWDYNFKKEIKEQRKKAVLQAYREAKKQYAYNRDYTNINLKGDERK